MMSIEDFISYMYTSEFLDLNVARFYMFQQSNIMRDIPPTAESLLRHIKRSAFQAGHIWGNTILQEPVPEVERWGWVNLPCGTMQIDWALILNADVLKDLVTTCKHQKSALATVTCKTYKTCAKKGLPCLEQCSCKRRCLLKH